MPSYNVKLLDYNGTSQIRYYRNSIAKKERTYQDQYDMAYTKDGGYVFKKKRVVDTTPTEKIETENIIIQKSERSDSEIERSGKNSMNRAKNKIYELARANEWEWFFTLTFNPQIVDSTCYDRVKNIVSEYFHSMRKRYSKDLKYLVVPELHTDGKKYHFHGVMSNVGNMPVSNSGHIHKGKIVYNLQTWHFGFSTVTRVTDTRKVSAYITKYITKELCTETDGRHRYLCSSNCSRPKVTEYEMTVDEYREALDGLSDHIGYAKTIKIPNTHNKVDYIEIVDL